MTSTTGPEKEKATSRTKQRVVAATISSLMALNTQVPVFSRRRRHRRRVSKLSIHSVISTTGCAEQNRLNAIMAAKTATYTPRKRWSPKKPKVPKIKAPKEKKSKSRKEKEKTLRPSRSEESMISRPVSPSTKLPHSSPPSPKPHTLKNKAHTLAANLRTVFCPLQRSPAPRLALGGRIAIPRFEKRQKHQSTHDMYMVFITSERLESAQGMRSPVSWERSYSVDEGSSVVSPRWPLMLDTDRGRSLSLGDASLRSPSLLSSRCWSPVSDERGRTPSLRYSSLGGLCPPPVRQQWGARSSSITEETMKLGPISW